MQPPIDPSRPHHRPDRVFSSGEGPEAIALSCAVMINSSSDRLVEVLQEWIVSASAGAQLPSTRAIVARYGAEILFAGDGATALCAEPGQSWDAVALVRYPKRAAFVEMIADPAYAVADPIRMSALEEAVLQPIGVMRLRGQMHSRSAAPGSADGAA